MKATLSALLLAALLLGTGLPAHADDTHTTQPAAAPRKTVGHFLLMYIPNRIFDVMDIVRARAAIGPGVALGVRLTDVADAWAGIESTTWVGLPGPRCEPKVALPVGLQSRAGAELSLLKTVAATDDASNYRMDEIGAHVHLLLVGAEVGVSIGEALDAVFGILGIDIFKDDL